nr:MATH domain-containing protein [Endozoicomonas sp.]
MFLIEVFMYPDSVMPSQEGVRSALRAMYGKKNKIDTGNYTRIPGSRIGVRNDVILNGETGQQGVSSNRRVVKNTIKNTPSMMNMETRDRIPQTKLGQAHITIIEIDGNRYLYQQNENANNALCRISEKNKHPCLESVFIGGDDNGFVDKIVAKANDMIVKEEANKDEANEMIAEAKKKNGEMNIKKYEAEKLTEEDKPKKDEILKEVSELSKNAGVMCATAMEMIANADDQLGVARKIKYCYKGKDWKKLRASNNECLEKFKEFDALSGHVSIEQSDQKVTISINHFNELLMAAHAIDNCLEYEEVKGFVTVGRGNIECKVVSPVLELVSGCKINLRMYPNGKGEEQGKSLSVFFDMVGNGGAKDKSLPKPYIKMEVALVNHADKSNSVLANMESGRNKYLREPAMVDLELLKDSEESKSYFLKDDILVMHCQFLDSIPLTVVSVKKN